MIPLPSFLPIPLTNLNLLLPFVSLLNRLSLAHTPIVSADGFTQGADQHTRLYFIPGL